MKKKILSLALALALLCPMLCVGNLTVLAEGTVWDGTAATSFEGGTGTKTDPYQIATAEQLKLFANIVNGMDSRIMRNDACAVLTADIVLNTGNLNDYDGSGTNSWNEWFPIGYLCDIDNDNYDETVAFMGTFDGQGHSISGIYINSGRKNVGLFGYMEGAVIKNVGVINSYISGASQVAAICGRSSESGSISNCYNSGTIVGSYVNVGGICAYNDITIKNCFNSGKITGGTVSGSEYAGGISGMSYGVISDCLNSGIITGLRKVGGVCGMRVSYDGSVVSNCYYLSGTAAGGINGADVEDSAEAVTDDRYTSGEVVWMLNGEKYTGDINWYLKDSEPTLDATGFAVKLENGVYSLVKNYGTTLTYTVDPTYTVTIPATVTLGGTVTVEAENVVVGEGKQVNVALTATSGANNAFTVSTDKGATLSYSVMSGTAPVSVGDTILSVLPGENPAGNTELTFSAPDAGSVVYSGVYTGTLTFTVSIGRQPMEFSLSLDENIHETVQVAAEDGMTWREWINSDYNIYGMTVYTDGPSERIATGVGTSEFKLLGFDGYWFESYAYWSDVDFRLTPDDVIDSTEVYVLCPRVD